MKKSPVALLMVLSVFAASIQPLHAEEPTPITQKGTPVPTTKILAVATLVGTMTPDERQKIMPDEVRATVALYLEGKLDEWFVRQDGKGVVFLFNAQSVDEVRQWTSNLPLVKAGILSFNFMPLGPLQPLQYLTDPGVRTH